MLGLKRGDKLELIHTLVRQVAHIPDQRDIRDHFVAGRWPVINAPDAARHNRGSENPIRDGGQKNAQIREEKGRKDDTRKACSRKPLSTVSEGSQREHKSRHRNQESINRDWKQKEQDTGRGVAGLRHRDRDRSDDSGDEGRAEKRKGDPLGGGTPRDLRQTAGKEPQLNGETNHNDK
jgi:hypothetical protein